MTTKTDTLTSSPGNPSRRSPFSVISDHPILFAFAVAVGAALVAGALYLVGSFAGSEEATIRVRNGSLEFIIERPGHEWTPSGASGNYRYRDGKKQSDDYEVIVVPAGTHTCNLYSKTGANIELTYSDDTDKQNKKDIKIVVQSQGRNTWVKPGTGATLTLTNPRTLTYTPTGYLSRVAVDNQLLCTFTDRAQLSSVLIMDAE